MNTFDYNSKSKIKLILISLHNFTGIQHHWTIKRSLKWLLQIIGLQPHGDSKDFKEIHGDVMGHLIFRAHTINSDQA